jgi:hypothetical protein
MSKFKLVKFFIYNREFLHLLSSRTYCGCLSNKIHKSDTGSEKGIFTVHNKCRIIALTGSVFMHHMTKTESTSHKLSSYLQNTNVIISMILKLPADKSDAEAAP